MMAPLMLRNKISAFMLMCMSPPMPSSVILGLQCGTIQMNSTTEMLKKTQHFVLGMRKISFCYCRINREQKVGCSFLQKTCTHMGNLPLGCIFLKWFFPLLRIKTQYLRLIGLNTFGKKEIKKCYS